MTNCCAGPIRIADEEIVPALHAVTCQARQFHRLRIRLDSRSATTSQPAPATNNSVTATARYASSSFMNGFLPRPIGFDGARNRALLSLFPRHIDFQSTPTHAGSGEGDTGLVSFHRIGHFDEGEAARTSRLLIRHDTDALNRTMGRKQGSQFVLVVVNARLPTYRFFIISPHWITQIGQ